MSGFVSASLAIIGLPKEAVPMRPKLAALTPPKPRHYDGIWNALLQPSLHLSSIGNVEIAENEDVHIGAQIARDSLLRPGDDGFCAVEAGIEDEGNVRQHRELFDETVEARVGSALDGLDTRGAVDVKSRRDEMR